MVSSDETAEGVASAAARLTSAPAATIAESPPASPSRLLRRRLDASFAAYRHLMRGWNRVHMRTVFALIGVRREFADSIVGAGSPLRA